MNKKFLWLFMMVPCSMEGLPMHITSPAFLEGQEMPALYTCDDKGYSPELVISDVPKNAKSLVLICDDPDAPKGAWVHWIIFNLPPAVDSIPENANPTALFKGSIVGKNSWHKNNYGGPCPPEGFHRYYFKLYALDVLLRLDLSATKDDVQAAMEGHILAKAHLMGRYKKKKS